MQHTIVITGTSTGFGFLAAQRLADKGHRVYATMRDIEGKNAGASKKLTDYSPNITTVELDVTRQDDIDLAVPGILAAEGRIDVLINNAGVMNIGLTEAFTIDELQAQMDVNYLGVARMFRAVLPSMRARRAGLVITVTSLAGRLLFPGFHSYNASKFAAEALAEGYRYELSPYGIDSVVLEPGPFKTELIANSPQPSDRQVLKGYGDFARMPVDVINGFADSIDENQHGDTNPQIVVDDMIRLIETPFGQRPARTVSGIDHGTRELNTVYERFQRGVLDAMQMAHLDPNQKTSEQNATR